MADITLSAYVQERDGKRLRVSEKYQRKTQNGDWETTGYGDFTAWLRDDQASPEVQAGAVVLISGRLSVDKREKDGKTYTNLNVNVNRIGVERLTAKYAGAAQQSVRDTGWGQAQQPQQWSQPDQYENLAPF